MKINYPVTASASAVTAYVPVVETCTVLGGYAVCNGVTLDEISTVLLKSGSTTLGTATFADNSAAGTVAAFVMDTTLATRKTKVTAAIPLSIVTGGEQTTVSGFDVVVRLDPLACPRD
jgi:hypothetical protein